MPVSQTEMQTCILVAWDLAVCSCLFLQGVLCAQFAHYMALNKRDKIWMKLFVAGLALLTTLKTLQSLMIMWIQNVTMFGDLEAGSNVWQVHWVWKGTPILEATTAFYVQIFFARRLWAISRNVYLVIICVILFVCGLVSGIVGIVEVLTNKLQSSTSWVGTHIGVVLCGDMLLTASTIICLLSAAPAALCALINFIADMRLNTAPWTPAPILLDFLANMVLPQLYAWSAMWTLNSREEICNAAGNNCAYTIDLRTSAGDSTNSETTRHDHQDHPEPPASVHKDQLNIPLRSMA
ncbi:hypothetical protein DFH08DRAFT_931114 [Mycena albidolilacea]|uniref:Uncharacterized protein n=1 Tax=Mycena albidolilacea TaxID=1033008 RepID=A0AAD7AK08_9AGAR|nr:hypothetical protein DFH08DRAFT_931114 [Mycena albidolilacea]